jgi:hypothetical protein
MYILQQRLSIRLIETNVSFGFAAELLEVNAGLAERIQLLGETVHLYVERLLSRNEVVVSY